MGKIAILYLPSSLVFPDSFQIISPSNLNLDPIAMFAASCLASPFTILEPQKSWIDTFYVVQDRRAIYLKAPKLWKGSSGWYARTTRRKMWTVHGPTKYFIAWSLENNQSPFLYYIESSDQWILRIWYCKTLRQEDWKARVSISSSSPPPNPILFWSGALC